MTIKSRAKDIARAALPERLWAMLRVARIRTELTRFPRHEVTHTYAGVPLTVCLADLMAQGWYDHDWGDLPEMALLRSHLPRNGRIFDLGAHQAVVAMILARAMVPEGQVVALEPNPHNASIAEKNRELNSVGNLEIVRAAIGAERGELVMNRGLNGQADDGHGSWGTMTVPCLTIDSLAEDYGAPTLVYLDVEGFEAQALRGAARVLVSDSLWFVEVHTGCGLEKLGGSVEQVFSFFPREKFELHFCPGKSGSFAALAGGHVPRERFFLVAVPRLKSYADAEPLRE